MLTTDAIKAVVPDQVMSENDMITVSGHNPQLRDLPVTESEIKLAFLTLSNYIHIEQQLSYGQQLVQMTPQMNQV